MSQIISTKNYKLFKKNKCNRDLDQSNLRKIKGSLEDTNMLAFRPIIVNKSMEIIDGQHRLAAAEELGLDIFYIIRDNSKDQDILNLNTNQKKWGTDDYVHYYESQGNVHYRKLREFSGEHNVSCITIARFFGVSRSNDSVNAIKTGKFVFDDELAKQISAKVKSINEICETLSGKMLKNKKLVTSIRFRSALTNFLEKEEVDVKTLMNKLINKIENIHPCATTYGYLDMIKDIYNWKNQNPI